MAQNSEHSARVGGHDFLNVEGNMEAQLLGRNIDDSTPLLQHDNICIRVPARTAYAIKQALVENISILVALAARTTDAIKLAIGILGALAAWTAIAIKEAIVENLSILGMSILLFVDLSLAFVAATRQEFNPMCDGGGYIIHFQCHNF